MIGQCGFPDSSGGFWMAYSWPYLFPVLQKLLQYPNILPIAVWARVDGAVMGVPRVIYFKIGLDSLGTSR